MRRTGFREAYRDDLPLRVMDLLLHVLAAVAIPGPWLLQWAPDLLVPALWLHGMRTDTFLPRHSPLLQVHRHLHLHGLASPPLLVLLLVSAYFWPPLCAHVLAHVTIDSFTHEGEAQ